MTARVWNVLGALLAVTALGWAETDKTEAGDANGGKPEDAQKWISLVPEEGMGKWKALNFGGEGGSSWKDGMLTIEEGALLTGIVWGGDLPKPPYELQVEARRTSGVDFFCGLTFPVSDPKTSVTLVVGGWGGGLVGISSIDGMDASENETTSYQAFKDDEWYKVRLHVRKDAIQAWIGDKEMVDVNIKGRKLGMRFGDIEKCAPLGLATYQTTAELRNIRWRKLED